MNILKIIFAALLFLATACSGQPLINGVDASASEVIKTLEVVSLHHDVVDGAASALEAHGGAKEFVNDLGVVIHLEQGYLGWGHLFLISEGDSDECLAGFDAELHVESVEDVMSEDLVGMSLGAHEIHDAAYCQYAVEFSSTHESMNNGVFVPEIENRSAFVSGTWNSGSAEGTFAIVIEEEFTTDRMVFSSLQDGVLEDHPLHFHEGENVAQLFLGSKYTYWFDGMDFSESSGELSEKLKDNIKANVHHHHGEILFSGSETASGGHHH